MGKPGYFHKLIFVSYQLTGVHVNMLSVRNCYFCRWFWWLSSTKAFWFLKPNALRSCIWQMLLSEVTSIAFNCAFVQFMHSLGTCDLDIAAAARRVISASEEQPLLFFCAVSRAWRSRPRLGRQARALNPTTWAPVRRRRRFCCPNGRRRGSLRSCGPFSGPSGPTSSSAPLSNCYRISLPSWTLSCSGEAAAASFPAREEHYSQN